MAASMISSAPVAIIKASHSRAPAATSMTPSIGLKSTFPITRKSNYDLFKVGSDGGRISCMKVWPPYGLKKFETLSYLPPLSQESLAKEIDYLLRSGWVPCLEFDTVGFVHREFHASPGYYDGRYWTMWKLPMFGCTDSAQVMKEIEEAKTAYPNAFIRVIGFDNKRQVQCCSFIVYKPENYASIRDAKSYNLTFSNWFVAKHTTGKKF